MPYTIVRLNKSQVDEMMKERLREDAVDDWTYDLVVEVDDRALQDFKPVAATLSSNDDSEKLDLTKIALARAIQTIAPA